MFINDIGSFNHFAISLCNFVFGIILITYNSEVNYSFKIFSMFWNILSDIDESFFYFSRLVEIQFECI